MAFTDILFRPSVLAFLLLIALYAGWSRLQLYRRVPKGVPWSKSDPDVKAAKTSPQMLQTLKDKFTDQGKKFIYSSAGQAPVLILPPSEIQWIISQPDTVLSAREMHRDSLQADWTFLNPEIVKNPIHEHVIRANMVRNLNDFTDPVSDELRQCIEDYWGDSTEWHEVGIWDSMLKFFSRTSNRMFVGLPLCRNESFLEAARGYASNIIISGVILKMMPAVVKPLLGYTAIAPTWWHWRKAAKYLLPLIKERQDKLKAHPEKNASDLLPNDFITWQILEAKKTRDPVESTPDLIAKRLMATNFAAIHTTTMTSSALLIDILTADPKERIMESLIEEITTIERERHGDWSKASLAMMTRLDSALRESMRLSGFVIWGIGRKVVHPDGVTTKDGTHIPYWGDIAVLAWGAHNDKTVYKQPFEYDAFRFSRQREALDGTAGQVHVGEEGLVQGEQGYMGTQEKDLSKVLEGKNLSTVTTGSNFMQFGHGKLSCPGRFFAVQEIKLMFAIMLQKYEIEYIPAKPEVRWMGAFKIPETQLKMRVRRRTTPLVAA